MKVEPAPAGNPALRLQVTVPVPPTAGVVQLQPEGTDSAWNVVPAGSVSVSVALVASLGPAFATVTW